MDGDKVGDSCARDVIDIREEHGKMTVYATATSGGNGTSVSK